MNIDWHWYRFWIYSILISWQLSINFSQAIDKCIFWPYLINFYFFLELCSNKSKHQRAHHKDSSLKLFWHNLITLSCKLAAQLKRHLRRMTLHRNYHWSCLPFPLLRSIVKKGLESLSFFWGNSSWMWSSWQKGGNFNLIPGPSLFLPLLKVSLLSGNLKWGRLLVREGGGLVDSVGSQLGIALTFSIANSGKSWESVSLLFDST